MPSGSGSRSDAQRDADRIRQLRDGLDDLARQGVLELTPDQRARFDQWAAARLSELSAQYDVDTTTSQKRVSWGLRIVSTLGGIAICAALLLFFARFWGYLGTPAQVVIAMLTPVENSTLRSKRARRKSRARRSTSPGPAQALRVG